LFTLDHRGAENIEWRSPLVNVPHQVFVSDANGEPAYVVTVDTWGNLGYAHSLVVYGSEGHVTADFALENLLTPAEISKVKRSAGSRWWAEQATFGFRHAPDGMRLVIRMNWGKVITVDLGRGKIVSPSK
jgi:hypothetical protein